jgi:hypothetical protein
MRGLVSVVIVGWLASGPISLAAPPPEANRKSNGHEGIRLNRLVVTPNGPDDGGDFGPKTPGTKTSGLQEAFDAAKAQCRDLYICGGNWTVDKTPGVVYMLQQTLRIPWMQDFHCDGGHYVMQYVGKKGDAVVMDSQMSCFYRFGLIASNGDGAVVRMRPDTAGPDRFKVITSSEFHFNGLVGGGGAWPSGEAFNSKLDTRHKWIGVGLWLDAAPGPIGCNHISVIEVVGCDRGVYLSGPCTNNVLEVPVIHLSSTHLQIGGPGDAVPCENRIQAFMHSEGIPGSVGARIFGHHNLLTLTAGQTSPGGDVIFEPSARDNLITALRLPNGITNRALQPTNRVIAAWPAGYAIATPPFPSAGEELTNRHPHPVEVRILAPGKVVGWQETDALGNARTFPGPLHAGQTFTLDPGDRIRFTSQEPATWLWKGLR